MTRTPRQPVAGILLAIVAAGVLGYVVAKPRSVEGPPAPQNLRFVEETPVVEAQCGTDTECGRLCIHDDYYCDGGPEGEEQLVTEWVTTRDGITYGLRQDGVVVWKHHKMRGH